MPVSLILLWFLIATAIPTSLWLTNIVLHKKWLNPLRIALISSISLYLILMALVFGYEFYLKYELQKFDLNEDGFFSGPELTEAQSDTMRKITNDTGRTFAPVTGGILVCLYFSLIWLTGIILRKFVDRRN